MRCTLDSIYEVVIGKFAIPATIKDISVLIVESENDQKTEIDEWNT